MFDTRKSWLPLVGICLAAGLATGAFGIEPFERPAPGEASLEELSFKVVSTEFVTELQGTNQSFETKDANAFRGLLVTVEIKKPAGKQVTLFGPDFSLHYYFGDKFDVVQCYGMSWFSTAKDTDRPMTMLGGGYGRTQTGPASSKAGKVYIDLFFQDLEPQTSELFLFVGQPVVKPFATKGWTP